MQAFRSFYLITKTVSDHTIVSASLVGAVIIARHHAGIAGTGEPGSFELAFLLGMNLAWYFVGRITGLYDEFRSRSRFSETVMTVQTAFIASMAVIIFSYLLKLPYSGYYLVGSFAALLLTVLVPWKLALNAVFQVLRKNGRNIRKFIIVGNGEVGMRFQKLMEDNPQLGYRLAGYVDDVDRSEKLGSLFRGPISIIETLVRDEGIDEVVLSIPSSENRKIRRVIEICEQHPVMIRMIPDFFEQFSSRFTISLFRDFPIITVRRNPLDELQWRFVKRTLDIAGSLAFMLLIGVWLFPLLALAVKCTSPGPVFFRQERLGKKNKRIVCYKFRSMVTGVGDRDAEGAYRQASRNDSRVTGLGRFLRKTNLDETPQVLNVLKGEMSLVGPRPHPLLLNEKSAGEVDRYLLRHLVKPGITGWAQVNGFRGNTEAAGLMRRRVEHDIWYIENWRFSLDFNIILLTVVNMFRGDKNAY